METQMTQDLDVGDRPGTKLGKVSAGSASGWALEDAPKAYDLFLNKEDSCMKCVLKPNVLH